MSMRNFTDPKDLLVAALSMIEMHPETWDQRDWKTESACGTTYCLAGWMAQLDGQKWERACSSTCFLENQAGSVDVGDWATSLLEPGFDPLVSRVLHPLFDALNTLEDLRVGVKAYLNDEDIADAIADAALGRPS